MFSVDFLSISELQALRSPSTFAQVAPGRWLFQEGDVELQLEEMSGDCEGFVGSQLFVLRGRGFNLPPSPWLRLNGFRLHPATESALANGYQCWTYSPILGARDILPPEHEPLQRTFGDFGIYEYAQRPGVFHSWMFSYSVLEDCVSWTGGNPFFGSLLEDLCHSVFEFDIPEKVYSIALDWEGLQLDGLKGDADGWKTLGTWVLPREDAENFLPLSTAAETWMEAIRKRELVGRGASNVSWDERRPVFGYTSWYYRYTDISAEWLHANLAGQTSDLGWQVFQVDDGYQRKVGDWLVRAEAFPDGVEALVPKIQERGLTPGIWCAPFVAVEGSESLATHDAWLLRDADGERVLCGDFFHWGGKFYAFDTENPEFISYLEEVLDTLIGKWGFRFIKADFLYASARVAVGGLTRAQRASRAHQFFWDACRKRGAALLSCGATLSSALGRCEFSRIGPDVEPFWKEVPPDGVGSREACWCHHGIVNAATRACLDGVAFGNDPDVFFLRDESCTLSPADKVFLAKTNAAFGSLLFCSDDPNTYGEWHRRVIRDLSELAGKPGMPHPDGRVTRIRRREAAGRRQGEREILLVERERAVHEVDFVRREFRRNEVC